MKKKREKYHWVRYDEGSGMICSSHQLSRLSTVWVNLRWNFVGKRNYVKWVLYLRWHSQIEGSPCLVEQKSVRASLGVISRCEKYFPARHAHNYQTHGPLIEWTSALASLFVRTMQRRYVSIPNRPSRNSNSCLSNLLLLLSPRNPPPQSCREYNQRRSSFQSSTLSVSHNPSDRSDDLGYCQSHFYALWSSAFQSPNLSSELFC